MGLRRKESLVLRRSSAIIGFSSRGRSMAAASDDRNQPEQEMAGDGDDIPYRQPPPYFRDLPREEQRTAERPTERRRRRPSRPRLPPPSILELALRTLQGCRRILSTLLRCFAGRPLGQRALEAVGYTLTTVEKATIWAGSATAEAADRPPIPFAWYLMVPVVMALMVVRTGAALAERYLDVQLPDNQELVNWLETMRIRLEDLQTTAARSICTEYIDENDSTHRLLNTWPFNIPYRVAQQLGIIPVKVDKQPSDTDSTPVPTEEPVTGTSSSTSSTLTEADERAVPSSRELTPQPESAGDRTMYYSPAGETQTDEEMETKEQQDKEEVEGEKAQEGKAEEPPTITAEEAERAARVVVQPQPSAPPGHLQVAEAERAAMSAIPPLPPLPSDPAASSEDLLAAEGASGSGSGPDTSRRAQKQSSKASRAPAFVTLFGAKLW